MTAKYTLTVRVETYEYEGEFYILGEGYDTPAEVLEYVAGDHILRIDRTRHVESYLLDVLKQGENASESEYEEWGSDLDCGIHADIYYQRFSFWAGDNLVEINQEPSEATILDKADNLR
jgi:hypothetical protein